MFNIFCFGLICEKYPTVLLPVLFIVRRFVKGIVDTYWRIVRKFWVFFRFAIHIQAQLKTTVLENQIKIHTVSSMVWIIYNMDDKFQLWERIKNRLCVCVCVFFLNTVAVFFFLQIDMTVGEIAFSRHIKHYKNTFMIL